MTSITIGGFEVTNPKAIEAILDMRRRRAERKTEQETGVKAPSKTVATAAKESPRIDLLGSSLSGGDT